MRELKVVFFTFIIFFCINPAAYAQGKEMKSRELARIRQAVQRINKEANYKLIKLEDAEVILGHATDGGASLTGFYKGDSLHKITAWVGLSNKVIQTDYYLDKGALVFVYSSEKRYAYSDSLQALDYTKQVPVFHGRYYFKNNRLYDAVLSDKKQKEEDEADQANGFLQRVNSYITLLQKIRK